jgi:hypothetical protein
MNLRGLVAITLVLACALAYHYEIEDGVYIAFDSTLQNLVDTTPFLMVHFCEFPENSTCIIQLIFSF